MDQPKSQFERHLVTRRELRRHPISGQSEHVYVVVAACTTQEAAEAARRLLIGELNRTS